MAKFNEKEIQIRNNAVAKITAFLDRSNVAWEKLEGQIANEDIYKVDGDTLTVSWLMSEYEGQVAW